MSVIVEIISVMLFAFLLMIPFWIVFWYLYYRGVKPPKWFEEEVRRIHKNLQERRPPGV